jgi:hypothetical protein
MVRPRLSLRPDFFVTYPLWDEWGLISNDPVELQALIGVSNRLLEDLREWQDEWETAMSPFADDGDPRSEPPDLAEFNVRHEVARQHLLERLKHEVGSRFECA